MTSCWSHDSVLVTWLRAGHMTQYWSHDSVLVTWPVLVTWSRVSSLVNFQLFKYKLGIAADCCMTIQGQGSHEVGSDWRRKTTEGGAGGAEVGTEEATGSSTTGVSSIWLPSCFTVWISLKESKRAGWVRVGKITLKQETAQDSWLQCYLWETYSFAVKQSFNHFNSPFIML